jgi:hypothetical protein
VADPRGRARSCAGARLARTERVAVDATQIPRIVFVFGKGGTRRSSVAAALGLCFASRGESTLIVEWTFAEAIAPWFGVKDR